MRNYYGAPIFDPVQAIAGHPKSSPVWLVGLNPYAKEENFNPRPTNNPMVWDTHPPTSADDWAGIPHYGRLKPILGQHFHRLGQDGGIASTDIVKCASPSFDRDGPEAEAVVHCQTFLGEQIKMLGNVRHEVA